MASISRRRRRTRRRAAPHRRSKCGATEDEDDRLSRLPNDLLPSILCAVPLKHPARTSLLSRLVCSASTDDLHGTATEESIASERATTVAAGQTTRGGEGEESEERAWTRRLGGRLAASSSGASGGRASVGQASTEASGRVSGGRVPAGRASTGGHTAGGRSPEG
jgi:hypothetical protein